MKRATFRPGRETTGGATGDVVGTAGGAIGGVEFAAGVVAFGIDGLVAGGEATSAWIDEEDRIGGSFIGGSFIAAGEGALGVDVGIAVGETASRIGIPKVADASLATYGGGAGGAALGGTAIVTVSVGVASVGTALSTQKRPWQCGQFT
jgi:hypothetical protein